MEQFMPDLPMASQRPVRTFADGGSVSNQQINDYIQNVSGYGALPGVVRKAGGGGISRSRAMLEQMPVQRFSTGGPTMSYEQARDLVFSSAASTKPLNAYSPAEKEAFTQAQNIYNLNQPPVATSNVPSNVVTTTPNVTNAANTVDKYSSPPINFSTPPSTVSQRSDLNAVGPNTVLTDDLFGNTTAYTFNLPRENNSTAAGALADGVLTGKEQGELENILRSSTDAGRSVIFNTMNAFDPTGAISKLFGYTSPVTPQTSTLTNAASTDVPAVSAASTAAPAVSTASTAVPEQFYRVPETQPPEESVTPQQRQRNFEQGVRDWFAANPNATLDQVNAAIAKIDKGSYDPFTRTFGLDGMTYKYDAAPGYSQQQFQSIVDDYLAGNPSLTYQQVQSQAQRLGLEYNPFTGKVTYGNITYTTPKGPRVSQEEFQRIVDDYFRRNPNATGEEAARVAASIGGEYNPFTQTVKVGNLSYKTPAGAGATFNQFQSLVDKYLSEGQNLTGEDVVRDAKSIGANYDPFTKSVTYKGYTYKATNAPGPTLNQFQTVVNDYLRANPNASAADIYLATKSVNFDYDPFTKQVTFGGLNYSPTGIKGYLNTPADSVIIDQSVVNRYRTQLNELNALAADNNQLQPLATRAKAIYDEVLARFNNRNKPPPPPGGDQLPNIIDDSRPVTPLPGVAAPDANFRRSPPRVWNKLLGAFTYAPPASISAPNPNQLPGAVAPGEGESWTPPVVTSRPRSLLNVRQNAINPRTGLPEYTAGYDETTGIFTAPVSRSSQAASDRSRGFAGLNAAMAGKRYTTPEYYSFLANVRSGAYGNPTDPDFPSKVKAAVDAYYASKPAS